MRTVIVGAGLTGLVVALRRAQAGDDVVLLEAARRTSGQIHTERVAGYVVEHGAEGYIARSDAVQALAADLGIAHRVREQLTQRSFGFDGSELRALEPGEAARFLGFQLPRDELGRGIRSFAAGMQELTDALSAALPPEVETRLSCDVTGVAPAPGGVSVSFAAAPALAADRVVIATGAARAAALLARGYAAGAALEHSPTLSSVSVTLAFARDRVHHALDGTGFVVAEAAQLDGFRACTFVSSKFADRAPPDRALIRSFFRPTAEELTLLSDSDYTRRAVRCLGAVIPLDGPPERAWVSRWPNALPVHSEEHRARVATLEAALRGDAILLAGAAFHGSGIDAAVRSAERAARELG